ncbi:MAG TPA: efflux transporter outer membrane subunit [Planctomycetota bacterium]|nr:efflux transporter outer membrane subunit [Planctomycetota bacterium]
MSMRRQGRRPDRPGGGAPLPSRSTLAAVLAASLGLLAASCKVPSPAAPAPTVALPQAFSASGQVTAPSPWWRAFGDARLDALMERSLAGNLTLLAAWDRLAQAEAVARRAGADLEPSLTGEAAASRTWTKTTPGGRTSTTELSLGLVAGYEVDLWRRVRSARDAALLAARASREDVDATALLLSAQVASTWYRLLDQLGQLLLLDEQIRVNQEYLGLMTFRFERPAAERKVSFVDILQQRQLVEATRAEKHRAESQRRVLEHQLAVLLGQAPDPAMAVTDATLPALPPLPQAGVPAYTLRQRPDLRAAELRLQAASRDVAAAMADRFPRLGLTARTEAWGGDARGLFDNWLASIASNLTAPLLDGGRRAAEVDRTRAVVAERLHAYGGAILDALQEVEDALVQERQQARFLASLEQQLDLAARASDQARERYIGAGEDYLRVFTAIQTLQRLQRDRLTARRQLIEFRINLHQALGGSWGLTRPETQETP